MATIAGWNIAGVSDRLSAPRSIDDAVRAVLLTDAVDDLVERGAPQNKLISKLKDVAQFEATWAELRCAAVIAHNSDQDVRVELEAGRSQGKHADLRLLIPDGPHTSVEIKAVGASDAEIEFMRIVAPSLDVVIPPHGMVSIHSPWNAKRGPVWSPRHAAETRREAARTAASLPAFPSGMSAAAIIAHGSEGQYVRRALDRIDRAIRQLPVTDESWVALHWSNGAPIDDVLDALDWSSLPSHVAGLMFVGAVLAFPHRNIDVFQLIVPRGLARGDDMRVESTLDDNFARTVLEHTQATPSVRATLLRGTIKGKRKQLLRRDGSERLPPFNLVLDRDPVGRSSM